MIARPTSTSRLADWLSYLETLHPKTIALGLDRVAEIARRLDIAIACPVFTVTGTNGKGSTCAYLDAILRAGGYRVGLYTSPHLLRYNERVRIDGVEATDEALSAAFDTVEKARGEVLLTYFEFGTLAALLMFEHAKLDALVLEVGLGGRLDAVNVIDADIAIITSIGIDHVEYLGGTRESIGAEKAGVLRPGRFGVCADPDPPLSLLARAEEIGARLLRIGTDFGYLTDKTQWQFWMRRQVVTRAGAGRADTAAATRVGEGELLRRSGLPHPALRGAIQVRNASAALTALELVSPRLAVPMQAIREGLVNVDWPARFQVLPGRPAIVLDVAHNPQAASILASNLGDMGYFGTTTAVFSILADKDIEGVAAAMTNRVDRWLVAPSEGARGADVDRIRGALVVVGVRDSDIVDCTNVADALSRATADAGDADRIVVFGSFVTIAAALKALHRD